eukprot:CAMPEP_0170499372 /NCGR_PEP_ID=MMETSP0208-20121228/31180_1 /TAXON_ID=197538 /ORGANISM="Strombidium inclinatum, Strain S3" /LENGTH=50 /DNA_ID=CAMNT_0010776893 /DNA_START=115 /DNA_END=264 /DNA_ORIENTATION=-
MIHKRYAHCSAYVRDKVLVFGGFSHADIPEEPPATLSSCEQLSKNDNYWE